MTVLADFTANALRLLRSHADEKRERLASDKVVEAHEKTEVSMHKVQTGLRADLLERTDQLEHLSARLIVHQDEERRRLARELHDSAGQYLAAILMNLGAAQRETSPAEREAKLAECRTMTEACLAEIRTISYLLHPPLLDEMGLRTALSMYTEGFAERSGIAVELNIPETFERLPSASETALFRVVQQSLANIHRHSGSASARISISMDAQQVEVQICDDGVGIAAEKLLAFNAGRAILGVGMAGMRERMRDMGGRFLIESTEKGTTIHATLPVA